VAGQSQATALTIIGSDAQAFNSVRQADAFETGAPSSASTSAVLAANSAIATSFGASPTFFGISELGGAHSTAATGAQTTTLETDETVDLDKLSSRQDLMVGLYNGTSVGESVSSVTFDLYADGVDVIHQTFSNGTAAQTYFTNNAVDVGSLATGPLSGSTLTLKEVLTVTSTGSGSGFYGQTIIGNAPALVQAMAAFGAPAAAMSNPMRETASIAHMSLSAPHAQIA
jgi:hypothetical protein